MRNSTFITALDVHDYEAELFAFPNVRSMIKSIARLRLSLRSFII
jgi:hypothetical protein